MERMEEKMPQTYEPPENPYIIDVDNGAEIARLIEQDRLFTHTMGGVLPEQPAGTLPVGACVLDLACGPGMWACDLAFHQRERGIWVCGVDLSEHMVQYAHATAQVQNLSEHTEFCQADLRQRLPFANGTFDLVNGRFLVGVLDKTAWPPLLVECRRVLKPGGVLRLTECETGLSSSAALQQMAGLLTHALWKQGRTFSLDGQTIGMAHRLGKLLLDAGLQEMQQRGLLTGGAPLQPTSTATTVRVRDGKTLITDGPFAETKEQLAGFYILNCKDLDEAIEMASKVPDALSGSIEIRPVIEF